MKYSLTLRKNQYASWYLNSEVCSYRLQVYIVLCIFRQTDQNSPEVQDWPPLGPVRPDHYAGLQAEIEIYFCNIQLFSWYHALCWELELREQDRMKYLKSSTKLLSEFTHSWFKIERVQRKKQQYKIKMKNFFKS